MKTSINWLLAGFTTSFTETDTNGNTITVTSIGDRFHIFVRKDNVITASAITGKGLNSRRLLKAVRKTHKQSLAYVKPAFQAPLLRGLHKVKVSVVLKKLEYTISV
jgi:hypothetical protein